MAAQVGSGHRTIMWVAGSAHRTDGRWPARTRLDVFGSWRTTDR
jgi:hypothetical protein